MEGIQPVDFGPEWDHMINLITECNYRPKAGLIIGPAKLHRIMTAASDEDRLAVQAMQDSGAIIVSHHLPDPEVAYRFEPRDPLESASHTSEACQHIWRRNREGHEECQRCGEVE